MSIRNSVAIALLCLSCSSDVIADGIWNPVATSGAIFGSGINNAQSMGGGGGTPVVGCAGTGFNFTLACNSQYLAVL